MSEKLDPNELMFLAGEGDLMVRDATTGKLVPMSVLEEELKRAEQKLKKQGRSDASTGVCWWQDSKTNIIYVLRIIKESPAALTRLKPGDVLIKVSHVPQALWSNQVLKVVIAVRRGDIFQEKLSFFRTEKQQRSGGRRNRSGRKETWPII